MVIKNKFYQDQLNLKFFSLKETSLLHKNFAKMHLYLNLYKVESFLDTNILESLFLLEFFTGFKTSINNCIYKYRLCNIQLIKHLNRYNNLIYISNIFKIFYLPSLKRQNFLISYFKLNKFQYTYNIKDINILPFLPNIYYRWKIPINISFFFNKKFTNEIILYLLDWGFYFEDEKDLIKYFIYIEKENVIN